MYSIRTQSRVPYTRYESFIRGPIPIGWLVDVSKLGATVLEISLSLWYLQSKKGGPFKASLNELADIFGRSEQTARRAISSLQRGGYISVLKRVGEKSQFSIRTENYQIDE
jgi:hypothetical protein